MTQLVAGWSASDPPAPIAEPFGHGLGVALCELQMLIGLQDAARLGRLRIPLDELATLGVTPEALARAPWPAALSDRLRERHRQLRGAVSASCAMLDTPTQRAAQRGLLVWATLMQQHSVRAERALPGTWQRSRWDGVGDALRAWRAARRST
jgi:hypothetical protein